MKAIEVLGTVDEKSQLHIDEPLPVTGPSRVRVIAIFSGEEELEEQEWLRTASANPAFEFLNDPVEDLYKPTDGVPFQQQFDDLSAVKVRPAVCLTEPIGPHGHVVLAFITSQIPQNWLETDLILDASQPDFALTGLTVSSTLRLHRLMTVATSMILRELGELSPRMNSEVDKRTLFGL